MANIAYRKEAVLSVGGFRDVDGIEHANLVRRMKREGWDINPDFAAIPVHLDKPSRYTITGLLKGGYYMGYSFHVNSHVYRSDESLRFVLIYGYPLKLLITLVAITFSFFSKLALLAFILCYIIYFFKMVNYKKRNIVACLESFESLPEKFLALILFLSLIPLEIFMIEIGKLSAIINEIT